MLVIKPLPQCVIPIGLSGGPASGKTSFIDLMKLRFPDKIITVPEVAKVLLEYMMAPPVDEFGEPDRDLVRHFQYVVAHAQIGAELFWARKIEMMSNGPKILLCDRTLFDGAAYTEDGLHGLSKILKVELSDFFERYPLVLRFESSAQIHSDARWKELMGRHRFEKRQRALEIDDSFKKIWEGNPSVEIIKATKDPLAKFIAASKIIIDFAGQNNVILDSELDSVS